MSSAESMPGNWRNCVATSYPFMPGKPMSNRMMSGWKVPTASSAFGPSASVRTS